MKPDPAMKLVEAARKGDMRTLARAWRNNEDLSNLLHEAARKGQDKVILFLLKHGVDINENRGLALDAAIEAGQLESFDLLLEKGLDPTKLMALRTAASHGEAYMVRRLLAHDEYALPELSTALQWAEEQHEMETAALVAAYAVKKYAAVLPETPLEAVDPITQALQDMPPEAIEAHILTLQNFRVQIRAVLQRPPASRTTALLLGPKGVTPFLRTITAAGLLGEFFDPASWQNREAEARDLLSAIRDALPEYRSELDAIDITGFRVAEPIVMNFQTRTRATFKPAQR